MTIYDGIQDGYIIRKKGLKTGPVEVISMGKVLAVFMMSALFLMSCADDHGACENPIPVDGVEDPGAPGFIVFFNDGVNAADESTRLSVTYGFDVLTLYSALGAMYINVSYAVIDHLRCESSIKTISHNGSVQLN